jgi:hypothetical protein
MALAAKRRRETYGRHAFAAHYHGVPPRSYHKAIPVIDRVADMTAHPVR